MPTKTNPKAGKKATKSKPAAKGTTAKPPAEKPKRSADPDWALSGTNRLLESTPTPAATDTAEHLFRDRIIAEGSEPPDQLLANPKNWRRHPKHQADALEGLLKTVGWVQRVIVNRRTGHLVDGHLRVELAMRRQEPTLPVLYVDLSEHEEDLVLAAIDPIGGLARTDQDQLDQLLAGLESGDAALDELLNSLRSEKVLEEPEEEPALSTDMPAHPVSQMGDLWILGEHRLLVGDSTAADDLKRLMDGERADAVFTDPPYAIYGSSTGIAADITDDKMVRPFFRDVITNCGAVLKPFGHVYICCDWRSWASWWEVAKGTGIVPKNMIVWDKGGGLGAMYANAHELLMFASFRPLRENMSQKISGERTVAGNNVWRVNRAGRDETGETRQHNAQKPVGLVTIALEQSTDAGQIVVDFFGGSGTTLIAAESLGRRCRMLEIDPRYADLIVQRWQDQTAQEAVLHGARATFAEIREQRQGPKKATT